jgi:flagellar protein FlaG
MAIEAISGVVQPVIIRGDGLPHPQAQGSAESQGSTGAHAELPGQAVKSVSPGQEEEQLNDAVKKTNDFINIISRELKFSIDKDTDTIVVKVIDTKTGDLIRQIPSKEMLAIAKALDTLQGLIIRKKV